MFFLQVPIEQLNPIEEINKAYTYMDKIGDMIVAYAPQFVLGVIILYFGLKFVNKAVDWLDLLMRRNNFDKDLRPFLQTLASVLLKMLLLLTVAEVVGIETTSFIAVLAAAGFAVGLALQGSLSNLAGGILILLFKPFKTGDLIRTQGYIGSVREIQILNTILVTNQNYRIVIPNSLITTGVIENLTGAGVIRVDMVFGVSYSDNLDKVKQALQTIIDECPFAVKDVQYQHVIQLRQLNSSSVDFAVCVWCDGKHYWDLQWFTNERVKRLFDETGIQIPFPQMDVHLNQPPTLRA